ncbi:hypothetical protein [Haploplasma modicum]|uniref:hypothetical protein n=1 Tax=Haploplasma modicum TaxID=2150 RepID=UPI00047A4C3D|nr:hypothetical protein [Haploplasma modicum]
MKIISYVDFYGNDLDTQVNTAKSLSITNIILRNIFDKKIYDLTSEDLENINLSFKDEKINIFALDPNILRYDIYNEEEVIKVLENYYKTIDFAQLLKVNNVFLNLPKINNVIQEYDAINYSIDKIVKYAKLKKINLLVNTKDEKTSTFNYLLKKAKYSNLSFIFNPSLIVQNKESVLVAYRTLKGSFNLVVANDSDKNNNPELLGYGKINTLDLFKRLLRDKYQGDILLDERFSNLFDMGEEKRVPFYKKLLPNKDKSILLNYSSKIFNNEPKRVPTLNEILESQISALKIIFNLK